MTSMSEGSIVLLAGKGAATCIIYHALQQRFGSETRVEVIVEERPSRLQLLKRRVRRLGVLTVFGHVLFMAVAVPVLRFRSRNRVKAIKAMYGLNDEAIPEPILRVPSANCDVARERLRALSPSVVVVSGTRLLSRETLAATPSPFINMHAGITPAYRGVHGGYWALAEGHPEMVGTTIHLVDDGIDTGGIIEQVNFTPTDDDTFWTYPLLHIAAGLPALLEAVKSTLRGNQPILRESKSNQSQLRYHPTLWSYLKIGCLQNVW
jgi:hypothetical protein